MVKSGVRVWREGRLGTNDNDAREARSPPLSLAAVLPIVAQSAAHLIATAGFHVCDATGLVECPSVFDLDYNNGIGDAVSTAVIATAAPRSCSPRHTPAGPRDVAAMAARAYILILVTIEDVLHSRALRT